MLRISSMYVMLSSIHIRKITTRRITTSFLVQQKDVMKKLIHRKNSNSFKSQGYLPRTPNQLAYGATVILAQSVEITLLN